ncbi:MAG TPA: cytochrome c biogenesis protein CcsA [Roseiflexaceae bacterium]|jgi:cytochrome c-type biogenesis protein CcmF|nr:cytochrome c biogenesis protein CcsA [Roseiflexaceae bacterium]
MYLLGTTVILSGLASALLAVVSYGLVVRGNVGALRFGRIGTRGALGALLLVVALLIYLFMWQRYDIKYVYDYSSADLEPQYRFAAFWAGQPGSFIIWGLWGLVAAQFLVRRSRHSEPYVLFVFMLIQAALLGYMLIRNPFIPYTDASGALSTPADGKGLNPTLHNPWMVIHPPILFIGYALMAMPFSYAIAGLWRRDYDGWVERALPWALSAWSFLGLALLLGGYWAYVTLGWGGFWGWDPVENSALVPWLVCTALIHCMLVQRAHGGLRRSSFALAILAYIMVFYATFLTRTGVLSSFSVHSFVEEGLKNIMIASLAVVIVASVAVLAWRWRDIPKRPLSEKLLSRDNFFVLLSIGLLVIATVIGVGTSMPVISAIPGVGHELQNLFGSAFQLDLGNTVDPRAPQFTDGRFGLVGSFYSTTVPPLALILLVLLVIGPLLGWRDTNLRHLLRSLRWPGVLAVIVTCVSLVLGVRAPLPLAILGLGAFALGTNVLMIIRTLKGGWMRIGGYLSHVGAALLLAGIVGSTTYATPDLRLSIPQNDSLNAYGYNFRFNDWKMTMDGKGVLDIDVAKGDDVFHAAPQLYFNQKMGATMATPAIKSSMLEDLYVSPAEYQPPVDPNTAILGMNETGTIGKYKFTFQGFDANMSHTDGGADVGAKFLVRYDGQEAQITPKLRLVANEPDPAKAVVRVPVTLPDGREVMLDAVDPTQRQALVRVNGLNLPVEPGKAVVTVSIKPGIKLVWLGVVIGVLGGVIASVRRALEGEARLGGYSLRVPGFMRRRRSARDVPALAAQQVSE